LIHVSQSCILTGTWQAPAHAPGDGHRALKRTSDNQLAYREAGPRTGARQTILLVHGWGVSAALFEAQLASLSDDFRVIVPDLPGHGDSASLPPGADFRWLADRLAALILELQPQGLCLVGWSLGAMVAWDLLRRHPGIPVRGLVTIDMVPRLLNDQDWPYGLRAGRDYHVFDRQIELMRTNWPASVDLFVPRILAPGKTARRQQLIARAKAIALGNDPQSMAAVYQLMVEQDFRADLAGIRVPALVMAGAQSQLYRAAASEWIAAEIPQAQLRSFDGSGHAPQLEQPEEFNRALADFAVSLQAPMVPRPFGHPGAGTDH
jgi:pimeloyl-[acyl-carrier protein] methyl ester esterase